MGRLLNIPEHCDTIEKKLEWIIEESLREEESGKMEIDYSFKLYTTKVYLENKLKKYQSTCKSMILSLPCPFCGSDTEIESTTFGDNTMEYFRVICKQEGHKLDRWSESKDDAISVWNQRTNK